MAGINNIAIFRAIEETKDQIKGDKVMESIAETMKESFARVLNIIHRNKYSDLDLEETKKIIDKSVKENVCFDLNTDDYSSDIINSCRTDIEVLKGAISIVGTILSANQYIAADIQTDKK